MLWQVAVRVSLAALRRSRRQVQARRMVAGSRAGLSRVRVNGYPVLAEVDPELSLPARAEATLATVHRVLTAAGVDFWTVPANLTRPMLGVRAVDQPRVLAALATADLHGWYRDRLTRRNRTVLRLERPGAALPPTAPGIVVWPYVVAGPDLGLRADQAQGVAITFWTPVLPEPEPDVDGEAPAGDPDEIIGWQCPVRNGALELLGPDEPTGLRGEVPGAVTGRHLARVGFDVDVVYTWVDGADPRWQRAKLAAAGEPVDQVRTERALDDTRFTDHDELRHSLRSVEQFAPWVRHIWIVTGGQRPAWLADHPRVTVVDHAEIWPDPRQLPTFNSHAIEACLHRIPGLSEHFLYLNDDMILGRPVRPERFFHGNGLPKFFWSNALVDYGPVQEGEIASTTAAKNARRLVADQLGVTFSRKFFHAPYPLRVSVLRELEERFPVEFARTRAARFRTVDDVAAAGSLYFNYAFATGRSVPGRIRYAYVDPAGPKATAELGRLLERRDYDTFCLNDGHTDESLDERAATDLRVRAFLAAYLPVASAFERSAAESAATAAASSPSAANNDNHRRRNASKL